MVPSIDVLTHVCSDVSQPAVMLHVKDGKRYVIGRIGEGFQRNLAESKIRSAKLQGIFLTGKLTWANVSGVPGYLLTLAETPHAINRIVHSNSAKVKQMYGSWKYINWHNKLNMEENDDTVYQDENLAIQSVSVYDSTCYVLQMLPVRGTFRPNAALALGVPKGKAFGMLTKGIPVTLPDGKTVFPHQVMDAGPTPSRVLFFDLPTNDHALQALKLEEWYEPLKTLKRKRDDSNEGFVTRAVYYFLGPEVTIENIQKLAAKLPEDCKHFVSHPDYSLDAPCFKSLNELQRKLRGVLPDVFPTMASRDAKKHFELEQNFVALHKGDKLALTTGELALYPRDVLSLKSGVLSSTPEEPEVITLGTGSSCPSKYRNVSATIVRMPADQGVRSVIFDCGEGTLNSLKRLYDEPTLKQLLNELDILYISHMHADHHLGVIQLITQWLEWNPKRKLSVMAPANLFAFLQMWSDIEDNKFDLSRVNFFDLESFACGLTYTGESNHSPDKSLIRKLQLADVRTCMAKHCDRAYCGVLTYPLPNAKTFKVAYSGDTRPVSFFSQIGRGCDLLIHEATHEDQLADEAKKKKHSTISEAISVGANMKTKHLVLTHFSQRYPKLPVIDPQNMSCPTAYGFDGMKFSLSQIKKIQKCMKTIDEIFETVEVEESES